MAFRSDGAQGNSNNKKPPKPNKTTSAIPALETKVNREAVQMKCWRKRKVCKIKAEIQ